MQYFCSDFFLPHFGKLSWKILIVFLCLRLLDTVTNKGANALGPEIWSLLGDQTASCVGYFIESQNDLGLKGLLKII